MPEDPTLLIFHPLEEAFLEGIERRLAGQAIINVLVVRVRFEPEFVGVRKEQQAEEQEDDDKSKGRLGCNHDVLNRKAREDRKENL